MVGAALSLLDAMYLPLHLPDPMYRFVGYGLPRVGNQAFADYMDDTYGTQLNHINNKSVETRSNLIRRGLMFVCSSRQDPVPILPGRGLGYHHPSGEIRIDDSDAWNSCPGSPNTLDDLFCRLMLGHLCRSRQYRRCMHDWRCIQHIRWRFERPQRSLQWHRDALLMRTHNMN